MRTQIIASALALSTAAACGGDDGPMNLSQFCQEYSRLECANVAPACFFPEADCRTVRLTALNAVAGAAEAAGRPFNPGNGQVCLDRVGDVFAKLRQGTVAMAASDFHSVEAACERVFQGEASARQPCRVNADCATDLVCDRGYCGTPRLVAPGGGCANTGEYCPQGSYCSVGNPVPFCAMRKGAGSACDTVPCLESLRCASGFCVDRLAVGLDCLDDSDCASGFCEPFALRCGEDVRFAPNSPACLAYQAGAVGPTRGTGGI